MDLGLVGLVNKMEERFGRTPVTVLLLLLYLLVASMLIQVILNAWVTISDLIDRGGRPGAAATFGSMVFCLVAWWLAMRTIRQKALNDFKKDLLKWNAEHPIPEEGSEKISGTPQTTNPPSRSTSLRDIGIALGVVIGTALTYHLIGFLIDMAGPP